MVLDSLPTATLRMFSETMRTVTTMVEITPAKYAPATGMLQQIKAVTRTLQIIRRDAEAENSEIVLNFDYEPARGPSGSFTRIIGLITGNEAVLNAEVRLQGEEVDEVTLSRGRSVELELVVSNLLADEDPTAAGVISYVFDEGDLDVVPEDTMALLDRLNRRYVLPLKVSLKGDPKKDEYTVVVRVRFSNNRRADAEFTVDVNDPPQYEGEGDNVEEPLTVSESGTAPAGVTEYLLTVVDPDGGQRGDLRADELQLEIVGFEAIPPFPVNGASEAELPYFDLQFGPVTPAMDSAAYDNGLVVTLTLTGKLATPFRSVVELRLFGVKDGEGEPELDQTLFVEVLNEEPTFELATTSVSVLAGEEVTVQLDEFSDGSSRTDSGQPSVFVQGAPDDLVVRVADDGMGITVRRLNDSRDEDAVVRLVVVDSQGGRKDVLLTIKRLPLLPEILPPSPLVVVAGAVTTTLQLRLAEATEIDVDWQVEEGDIPGGVTVDPTPLDNGHLKLAVMASMESAGAEFDLMLIVSVGDADSDGMQQRTAVLPVVVVAAKPKPRLSLALRAAEAEPTVSSFILTDTLFIEATLEGETALAALLPDTQTVAILTFTIGIRKLNSMGEPEGDPFELERAATVSANDSRLSISAQVTTTAVVDSLSLAVGDVVEVSVVPMTTVLEGDSLHFSVVAGDTEAKDSDNDGLLDTEEPKTDLTDPAVLGPITAAFVKVTDGGVVVQDGEVVLLSLGEDARRLGLGQCGRAAMALTVDSAGGNDPQLSLCDESPLTVGDAGRLSDISRALTNGDFADGDGYQLIDLRARFDSFAVGEDGLVLVSLPSHPEAGMFYRVYRLDDQNDAWVPVLAAGLPADGSGGALESVDDCNTCIYLVDVGRDGSLEELLLLESVERELSFEVATDYQDRIVDLGGGLTKRIPLTGLLEGTVTEDLRVMVGGDGNVTGRIVFEGGSFFLDLTGRKRTRNGAEQVLVELLGEDGMVASSRTLQVRVPNQRPVISFLLLNGEEITEPLRLESDTETIVVVRIEDPDDDDSFDLRLIDDGGEFAELVSRVTPSADDGGVFVVEHRLILTSKGPRSEFNLIVSAIDVTDRSLTDSDPLKVCVLNDKGECPAATRRGGGGGGGSGLLWLLLGAPAALVRLRRLQRLLTARPRRQL